MNTEEWKQARLNAFHSIHAGKYFFSIAQPADVWANDPFDEESIHSEARLAFGGQLEIASNIERGEPNGRILLLKGIAGAGKTHLMGAFRREVERTNAGYFAYAQMSTASHNIESYLLRNIVECLQKCGPYSSSSPWLRLSDALVEQPIIPAAERESLREDENYQVALDSIRARLLERLKPQRGQAQLLHSDFLTALIVLQRRDGNAQSAAMNYFRGDPLSATDLNWLCSPQGLAGTGNAERLMDWILQAVRKYGGARGSAFVLCLDQMEDLYDRRAPSEGQKNFPEMIKAVRRLSDTHPGLFVVLACLADHYTIMRDSMTPSDRDRVEMNPEPVQLKTNRTTDEIEALVKRRLEVMDADSGISTPQPSDDELFPFNREELKHLQGLRPRAILGACWEAWNRSRASGSLPQIIPPATNQLETKPIEGDPIQPNWAEKWNDVRSGWNQSLPDSINEIAELLAWSIDALAKQARVPIQARAAADLVQLTIKSQPAVAAICNGAAQGGKLSKQIDSLEGIGGKSGKRPIAIRSTDFAKSPKAQIAKRIQQFIVNNGKCVIFPDSDWRTLHAWRAFSKQFAPNSEFVAWAGANRPLAEIAGLKALLEWEELADEGSSNEVPNEDLVISDPPEVFVRSEPYVDTPLDADLISLGNSLGLRSEPVAFERTLFTQHMAVLGGTGSGKTTAAMVLLEGLLMRDIPVILVDRKGDLARYADVASIAQISGPMSARFRDNVDIALFTPGSDHGRPLALSVLPTKPANATSQDLNGLAGEAASALSAMLGYTESQTNNARRAALASAIGVLLEVDDTPPDLERLLMLIHDEDPALLQALGRINRRHLPPLVEGLESFRKLNSALLGAGAEPLDSELLLGLGAHSTPGKTRLCVISTKFLGADEVVQFWVAQLMMELARFASARPSNTLQAVIMLDEADLYLPANKNPASKLPVENALRRFRSGGLGLVLASQSPGDFDYRCRENIGTWLVGKIGQPRALEKLKTVFGSDVDIQKLGQQATGEFSLVRPGGRPISLKSHLNLLATKQMSETEIQTAAIRLKPRSNTKI